jgi:nicotinate-nucleotide pyrophosphorylase (carboxylating)
MSQKFSLLENLENLLPLAFAEDTPDITSQALADLHENIKARIIAKAPGVICGLPLLPYIYTYKMCNVSVNPQVHDGDVVQKDTVVAILEGSALGILSSERIGLNFLQRLSGIATLTRKFLTLVQGTKVVLLDTRKTTPGWRHLEKYATRVGGAKNNRMSASEAVMLKDNHIALAKGLAPAVKKVRDYHGDKVEVVLEVRNLQELQEAFTLPVNKIMLDNFAVESVREAVALAAGRIPLEATGGINMQNIKDFAATGVNFISIGAITHSAPALDLSLEVS